MLRPERARSRTFVVTGAASGIGLSTARRLLAEGGTVVGIDLAPPPENLGTRFEFVAADITDEAAEPAIGPPARSWPNKERWSRVAHVSGQAIAVDGGYTAGRDHGVVKLFGFPD